MKDKSHKILVVDDDLKWCELLSDILKDEGYSVTTSGNSLKALKILKEEEFDVILTLQAKLLRVIEEKEVRPLGDTVSSPVDVRIISTSNRDIKSFDRFSGLCDSKNNENLLEKAVQEKYSFNELLKEYIKKIMIEIGGNKIKVSEILGIDRKTLY